MAHRCIVCDTVRHRVSDLVPILLDDEVGLVCRECLESGRLPDSTGEWGDLMQRRELSRLGWLLGEALDAAEEEGIPALDLDEFMIDPDATALITMEFALRHSLIPVTKVGRSLVVAMADPYDEEAVDRLHKLTGLEIRVALAPEHDVRSAIRRHYRAGVGKHRADEIDIRALVPDLQDGTIVNLVNLILSELARSPATEVRIERNKTRVQVLYRIDGLLNAAMQPPGHLGQRLTDCFRLLARLSVPKAPEVQFGLFKIVSREGRRFTLHVEIRPHRSGENLTVIREETGGE